MAVIRSRSARRFGADEAAGHRDAGPRPDERRDRGGSHPASRPSSSRSARRTCSSAASSWTPLFETPYEVDGYLSPLFSPLIAPAWLPYVDQPRPPDPLDPARLPGDLLLLPQGLLPVLLRRPARLRGRRADGPPRLQAGDGVPVHPPEPPPLLPVSRVHPAVLPVDRRGRVDLPAERRHPDRARGVFVLFFNVALLSGYSLSCHSLRHVVGGKLDCFSCSRGASARYSALAAADGAQPAPHGVGLGEPDHGHVRRRLRPAARARGHHRPGDPVLIADR